MTAKSLEEFVKELESARERTGLIVESHSASMANMGGRRKVNVPYWTTPTASQVEISKTELEAFPTAIEFDLGPSEPALIKDYAKAVSELSKILSEMESLADFNQSTKFVVYLGRDGDSLWGIKVQLSAREHLPDVAVDSAAERIEPLLGIAYDQTCPDEIFDEEQKATGAQIRARMSRAISGRHGKTLRVDSRPLQNSNPDERKQARIDPPPVHKQKYVQKAVGRIVGNDSVNGRYRVKLCYIGVSGEEIEESAKLLAIDPEFLFDMAKETQALIPLKLSDEKFTSGIRHAEMRIDRDRFSEGDLLSDFMQSVADSPFFGGLDIELVLDFLEGIYGDVDGS